MRRRARRGLGGRPLWRPLFWGAVASARGASRRVARRTRADDMDSLREAILQVERLRQLPMDAVELSASHRG